MPKPKKEDIIFYSTQQAQLDSRPIAERIGIVESMGFHLRTTAQEYEENTRTILADIRAHARKVIFALSTPVPLYYETLYTTDCIAEYNDIAVKVCREMDIPINDLYSVAAPLRADQKDGCVQRTEQQGFPASAADYGGNAEPRAQCDR